MVLLLSTQLFEIVLKLIKPQVPKLVPPQQANPEIVERKLLITKLVTLWNIFKFFYFLMDSKHFARFRSSISWKF